MVSKDHIEDPDQREKRMNDPKSPEKPEMARPSQAPGANLEQHVKLPEYQTPSNTQDDTETGDKTMDTTTEQDQTEDQTKVGATLSMTVTIEVNKLDISINDIRKLLYKEFIIFNLKLKDHQLQVNSFIKSNFP